MTDRTISVTLDLVDNVTSGLKDIMALQEEVQTPVDVTIDTGDSKKEVGEVTKSVKETGKESENSGKQGKSAFQAISDTAKTAYSSVMDLVGSVIALTAGAYGLSTLYESAAKTNLYVDQMGAAIEANKALGISQKELQAVANSMDWETPSKAMESLYNTIGAAQGALGTGSKALEGAKNVNKYFESRQESMEANGFQDTTQLIRMATMSPRAMSNRLRNRFQAATALNPQEMATSASRVEALAKRGINVDMSAQEATRPWVMIDLAIRRIKKSIGDSIAGPMYRVFTLVANILDLINSIPYGGAIIGLAIGLTTLGAAIMTAVVAYNMLFTVQNVATIRAIYAAVANGTLTTSFVGLAESAWAAALGVWGLLAPLLPVIAAGAAIVGVLYLINEKTGIFTKLIAFATSGLSKLWDIMRASAGFSIVASLFGVDSKALVNGVDDLNDKTARGNTLWSRITDILTGAWDTLKGLWETIKSPFGMGSVVASEVAGAIETSLPVGLRAGIDAFLGKTKTALGATTGNTGNDTGVYIRGNGEMRNAASINDEDKSLYTQLKSDSAAYKEWLAGKKIATSAATAAAKSLAPGQINSPYQPSSKKSGVNNTIDSIKKAAAVTYNAITGGTQTPEALAEMERINSGMASGTPYVPQDMITTVHKGERIVPASQNRAGMGGTTVNNISLGGISVTHNGGAAEDARLVKLIETTIKKVIKPMGRT